MDCIKMYKQFERMVKRHKVASHAVLAVLVAITIVQIVCLSVEFKPEGDLSGQRKAHTADKSTIEENKPTTESATTSITTEHSSSTATHKTESTTSLTTKSQHREFETKCDQSGISDNDVGCVFKIGEKGVACCVREGSIKQLEIENIPIDIMAHRNTCLSASVGYEFDVGGGIRCVSADPKKLCENYTKIGVDGSCYNVYQSHQNLEGCWLPPSVVSGSELRVYSKSGEQLHFKQLVHEFNSNLKVYKMVTTSSIVFRSGVQWSVEVTSTPIVIC